MLPEDLQVMVAVFVLAGLIGWVLYDNHVKGVGTQPIWTSPEYLRYNRPVSR